MLFKSKYIKRNTVKPRLNDEARRNGYAECLTTADGKSILATVNSKMGHQKMPRWTADDEWAVKNGFVGDPRHLEKENILALVLYTSSKCASFSSREWSHLAVTFARYPILIHLHCI